MQSTDEFFNLTAKYGPLELSPPMTRSDPCMFPLGLKPKPTQPVVLTTSWNVMVPWRSSKPHFKHTRCSWSRYSMKGRPGSDDAQTQRLSSTARRGSSERMAQSSVKSDTP